MTRPIAGSEKTGGGRDYRKKRDMRKRRRQTDYWEETLPGEGEK